MIHSFVNVFTVCTFFPVLLVHKVALPYKWSLMPLFSSLLAPYMFLFYYLQIGWSLCNLCIKWLCHILRYCILYDFLTCNIQDEIHHIYFSSCWSRVAYRMKSIIPTFHPKRGLALCPLSNCLPTRASLLEVPYVWNAELAHARR